MSELIDQFINFLAVPQGNLIYSLVIGVLALGAYQASLYAGGGSITTESKRMRRGLLILVLVLVILFLLSWLAWIGIIDSPTYLPTMGRTIALFSLVLVIWLWVFPKPTALGDALSALLEIVLIAAGIYGLFWLSTNQTGIVFNASVVGAYAYYTGVIFSALGLVLLFLMRPKMWGYGALMLVILLLGYLGQYLFLGSDGDFPWAVMLGEMAAFTILLVLPRRLVKPLVANNIATGKKPITETAHLDVGRIQSFLDTILERDSQQFYLKFTRQITLLMDGATCLLIMPPKSGNSLIIPVGYDAVNDHAIDGFTLDGQKMPALLEAVHQDSWIQFERTAPNSPARILADELAWIDSANILVLPIKFNPSNDVSALMLLAKPAQALWSEQDRLTLKELLDSLVVARQQIEGKAIPIKQQEEAQKYRQAYLQLKNQYDALTSRAQQAPTQEDDRKLLLERQSSLQELVKHLDARNRELEELAAKSRPSVEEVEQLRRELKAALADLARMPTTLSKSDQKMLELQLSAVKQLDTIGQTEMVTSIAQEIRHPVSSISGYTDLLLGESIGILGAMQRRFLERIKASTERLSTLLNDLVQFLAFEDGKLDRSVDKVDLKGVVEEAVGEIVAQIKEKNIHLQVNLPNEMPEINANKDALQQILVNLLQNACIVTPAEAEICLSARIERQENETDYLILTVSDQGCGISNADLPRIFLRQYRAENPTIKGIGETGVGLSIAKSLVELYKGRIWVDSKEGVGSTFSCLIPLTNG